MIYYHPHAPEVHAFFLNRVAFSRDRQRSLAGMKRKAEEENSSEDSGEEGDNEKGYLFI